MSLVENKTPAPASGEAQAKLLAACKEEMECPGQEAVGNFRFGHYCASCDSSIDRNMELRKAIESVLASSLTPLPDVEPGRTLVFRRNGDDRIEVDPAGSGVIVRIADYKDRAQFVLTWDEAATIARLLARVPPDPQPPVDTRVFESESGHAEFTVPPAPAAQARSAGRVDLEKLASETALAEAFKAGALWCQPQLASGYMPTVRKAGRDYLAALQRARETGDTK